MSTSLSFRFLEICYRLCVWLTRLAFPAAGFVYGFLTFSLEALEHPRTQATNTAPSDPLMDLTMGIALLITIVAAAGRMALGSIIKGQLFNQYAKAFDAKQRHANLQNIINSRSILLSKTYEPILSKYAVGLHHGTKVSIAEVWAGYFESGNSSSGGADYLVFILELPGNFPHIFIDGQAQGSSGLRYRNLRMLQWKLQHAEKTQKLEGDFPKHFQVYAPPNQQIETLSILTPDVMLIMRDLGRGFDYEIIDNQLYITADPSALKGKKTDQIIMAVRSSIDELIHQLKRPDQLASQRYLKTGSGMSKMLSGSLYFIYLGVLFVAMFGLVIVALALGGVVKLLSEYLL